MTESSPTPKSCPTCGSDMPKQALGDLCPACLMKQAAKGIADEDETVPMADAAPSIEGVSEAFPEFEIEAVLGSGGMGSVFRARQRRLDRLVALKILDERLAEDPAFQERFEREGRALAKLSHPNIVGIHDIGEAGGFPYILMEYVDGVNLRQAMAVGQFSPEQAMRVIPYICEALQSAHEQGVLHRDIKPENILIATDGTVKIADFGVAKIMGDSKEVTLTRTGGGVGTPQYMAPEQIESSSDVDHLADIYSLGVVFYEMLTGELPLGRFAPPSDKAKVGARVDEIVFRALAKEKELRQQSATDLKTEIEEAETDGGTSVKATSEAGGNSAKEGAAKVLEETQTGLEEIFESLPEPVKKHTAGRNVWLIAAVFVLLAVILIGNFTAMLVIGGLGAAFYYGFVAEKKIKFRWLSRLIFYVGAFVSLCYLLLPSAIKALPFFYTLF